MKRKRIDNQQLQETKPKAKTDDQIVKKSRTAVSEKPFAKIAQKKKKSKKSLKKEALQRDIKWSEQIICNALRDHLKTRNKPNIEEVTCTLEILESLGELQEFMRQTNYFVFDWSLEHENLQLLDTLLRLVEPQYHLLMVEHNHYAPLKQFLQKTLDLSYNDYQHAISTKNDILTRLIKIDPKEINHAIKNTLTPIINSNPTINLDTLEKFTHSLNDIISQINSSKKKEPIKPSEHRTTLFPKNKTLTKSPHKNHTVHFNLTKPSNLTKTS